MGRRRANLSDHGSRLINASSRVCEKKAEECRVWGCCMFILKAILLLNLSADAAFTPVCGDDFIKKACQNGNMAAPLDDSTGQSGRLSPEDQIKDIYKQNVRSFDKAITDLVNKDASLRQSVSKYITGAVRTCRRGVCQASNSDIAAGLFNAYVAKFDEFRPRGGRAPKKQTSAQVDIYGLEASGEMRLRVLAGDLLKESRKRLQADFDFKERYYKNTLIPKVQQSLAKTLSGLPDGPEKTGMLDKINKLAIKVESCGGLLEPNAFYDSMANDINYCESAAFISSSLFREIFVLAHEAGHSIDPCVSKYKGASSNHLENLVSCLRRSDSIEARNNGAIETSRGCVDNYNDQIGECVADWLAGEVLADLTGSLTLGLKKLGQEKYGNGIANAISLLCGSGGPSETHPSGEDRYRLLLNQPKIAERMGCTPDPSYQRCSLQGASAEVSAPVENEFHDVGR